MIMAIVVSSRAIARHPVMLPRAMPTIRRRPRRVGLVEFCQVRDLDRGRILPGSHGEAWGA